MALAISFSGLSSHLHLLGDTIGQNCLRSLVSVFNPVISMIHPSGDFFLPYFSVCAPKSARLLEFS